MNERILIRHGQSQYNLKLTTNLDSELTEFGQRQVRAAAQHLREKFPHLKEFIGITSPYLRCLQTATIVSEETGVDFLVHPGPREIMVSYEECRVIHRGELFPKFQWLHAEDLHFVRENEETFNARMKEFQNWLEQHPKAIIVSHGTPCGSLTEMFCGFVRPPDVVNYPQNASLTYIQNGGLVWKGKVVYDAEVDGSHNNSVSV